MRNDALAVDLGGTKIAVARVSRSGRISGYATVRTPAAGGRSVVEAALALLERRAAEGPFAAMGVAVPGLAYPDGRVWAPNLPGWEAMPLGRLLGRRFGMPVVVESDRNAFVTGEAWRGAARGSRDAVFLAVGTGIGAGILAGGRLLRGHGELAGAVGWMAVGDEFLPEYGRVGCLEALASGRGIGRAATRHFGRETSAVELVLRARRGDARAKAILHRAGRALGLAMANLVDVLNPEIIVVGGGVAEAGELLLKPARATMRRWAQPLASKQVRVARSRLGPRAALWGAAKLAFDFCDG